MMTKDKFVFSCITGYAIDGRSAGAENDGWRDRNPISEAQCYYEAIVDGDLGTGLQDELEDCDGHFDAEFVGRMLQIAKQQPQLSSSEVIEMVLDQYASDAFVDATDFEA